MGEVIPFSDCLMSAVERVGVAGVGLIRLLFEVSTGVGFHGFLFGGFGGVGLTGGAGVSSGICSGMRSGIRSGVGAGGAGSISGAGTTFTSGAGVPNSTKVINSFGLGLKYPRMIGTTSTEKMTSTWIVKTRRVIRRRDDGALFFCFFNNTGGVVLG